MLLSYGSGQQQIDGNKNYGKSLAILIVMAMQRYNAGHITQWSTSRASFEATGCRHRVMCPASYRPGGAMVKKIKWNTQNTNKTQFLASNYGTFWSLVVCENFNLKTNPLFSSSMQQASCKCETPRFELKSSCTFLAIKRCQRTKFGKVIKLVRSSIK